MTLTSIVNVRHRASRGDTRRAGPTAGPASFLSRAGLRRAVLAATALSALLCCFGLVWADDPLPEPTPVPVPGNLPPMIVDFVGIHGQLGWIFEGRVVDENPQGLVVTFGGVLDGHQTTVRDPEGYFQYAVSIQGPGAVTAYTIDDHGKGSNIEYFDLP